MTVFNNIMDTMNTQFNLENKLTLLASTTEVDTTREIMVLFNHIGDAIGTLTPFDYKIVTTDVDTTQPYDFYIARIR